MTYLQFLGYGFLTILLLFFASAFVLFVAILCRNWKRNKAERQILLQMLSLHQMDVERLKGMPTPGLKRVLESVNQQAIYTFNGNFPNLRRREMQAQARACADLKNYEA